VAEQALAQNAVVVFGDLQDGIIDHAHTNDPASIDHRAAALAKVAALYGLPIIVTTVPMGSGALSKELGAVLGSPTIHQRTTTSAFDHGGFLQALEATKRRVLLIGGVASEIVVQRMALAALQAGFAVQVVVDASGGFGERSEQAAFARIQQAGGTLTSVPTIIGELAADFTQPQAGEALGLLMAL
jgi:nicotinamidase-related amidase